MCRRALCKFWLTVGLIILSRADALAQAPPSTLRVSELPDALVIESEAGWSLRSDAWEITRGLAARADALKAEPLTLAQQERGARWSIKNAQQEHSYALSPQGLTHSVMLWSAPEGRGELRFSQQLKSDALSPRLNEQTREVELIDAQGRIRARLSAPLAWDATGRALPARHELLYREDGAQLSYVVDDTLAVYPIVVDPLLYELAQKINATIEALARRGEIVAIHKDLLALGLPGDSVNGLNAGAIEIYKRVEDQWLLEATLRDPAGAANHRLGAALTINQDTLAAISPGANTSQGRVVLYKRGVSGQAITWSKIRHIEGLAFANVAHSIDGAVASNHDLIAIGYTEQPAQPSQFKGAIALLERNQGGADQWGVLERFPQPAPPDDLGFGDALDIADDGTLIVGAPKEDTRGQDTGQAYVYKRKDTAPAKWDLIQEIGPSITTPAQAFGSAVSISDGVVLVGAPGESANAGGAYLFEQNQGGADQWGQAKRLEGIGGAGARFGSSVALDHDLAAIGAPRETAGLVSAGAIYSFERNQGGADQWGRLERQTATTPTEDGLFGAQVAFHRGSLVAGHPGVTINGLTQAGELMWLPTARSMWTQHIAGVTGSGLGASIVADRRTLAIGVPYDNTGGARAGSVYLYSLESQANSLASLDETTLPPPLKLAASNAQAGDRFGTALALMGDYLAVGAHQDSAEALGAGRVGKLYLFKRQMDGIWIEHQQLNAPLSQDGAHFGFRLAAAGRTLYVSAPNANAGAGAVFVYQQDPLTTQWSLSTTITPEPADKSSFGQSISARGDALLIGAAGAVYLHQRDANPNAPAYPRLGSFEPMVADSSYGRSVALGDERLIIGAPQSDVAAQDGGEAEIYTRQGNGAFTLDVRLTLPNALLVDHFGASVALEGDQALVGAPGRGVAGQVTRYEHIAPGRWQVLSSHEADANIVDSRHGLGAQVALIGGTAFMGAPGIDGLNAAVAGQLYISQPKTIHHKLLKTLTAPTPEAAGSFGASIASWGSYLLVGAPGQLAGQGQAYLYGRNVGGAESWGLIKTLSSSSMTPQGFGRSVALNGRYALVGAPDEALATGSSYLFDRHASGVESWTMIKALSGERAGDRFGASVAMQLETLLIGAPGYLSTQGAAYLYQKYQGGANVWGQQAKLTAQLPTAGANFGAQLALDNGRALIASPYDGQSNASAATIFAQSQGGANAWGRLNALFHPLTTGYGASVNIDADRAWVNAAQGQQLFSYHFDGAWRLKDTYSLNALFGEMSTCEDGALAKSPQALYLSCQQQGALARLDAPQQGRLTWLKDSALLNAPSAVSAQRSFIFVGQANADVAALAGAGQVSIFTLDQDSVPSSPSLLSATSLGQPAQLRGEAQAADWVWIELRDSNDATLWAGFTRADANGRWEASLPPTPQGAYKLWLYARRNDKVSTSTNVDITLNAPLFASIEAPQDGAQLATATPSLNGIASGASAVALTFLPTQGGAALQQTYTIGADLRWSGVSPTLQDGIYQITAQVSDGAQSYQSDTISVEIDTTGPALTLNVPGMGLMTNQDEAAIVGSAEPGATITLTLTDAQGQLIYTVTVTADQQGMWSTTLELGPQGTHSLEVVASDSLGNTTTEQRTITLDQTAPTLSITAPPSRTKLATPSIAGQSEPGASISITLTHAQQQRTLQATADLQGQWSATPAQPLLEGDHSISAQAQDPAGNQSPAVTSQFTVDLTAPTLSINSPTQGASLTMRRPQLEGLVSEGPPTLTLSFAQEATPRYNVQPAVQAGMWTYTPDADLDYGSWQATLTTSDDVGNTATVTHSFTIAAPPALTVKLLSPGDGLLTNNNEPQWRVQISRQAELTLLVDDEPLATITHAGGAQTLTWSGPYPAPLTDGEHKIKVSATDNDAQQASSAELTITIDTLAPLLRITSPPAGITLEDNTPMIVGETEPGLNVEIWLDEVLQGRIQADLNGQWRWATSLPGLSDGEHTIRASTTDQANNKADTGELSFTVEAPKVIIEDPGDDPNSTTNNQPTFRGEAPEGSKITVIILDEDGQEIHRGTTTADAEDRWRYRVSEPLPDGGYTVVIEIEQPDGQKKRRTLSLNINAFTPTPFDRSYCTVSSAPIERTPISPFMLLMGAALFALSARRRRRSTR